MTCFTTQCNTFLCLFDCVAVCWTGPVDASARLAHIDIVVALVHQRLAHFSRPDDSARAAINTDWFWHWFLTSLFISIAGEILVRRQLLQQQVAIEMERQRQQSQLLRPIQRRRRSLRWRGRHLERVDATHSLGSGQRRRTLRVPSQQRTENLQNISTARRR